ncbi:ATP-dependent Clp protease ATP-binding subunit ClpA [Candidatus Liberibacter solanacearum]|uniref:ATP-dependent Clp protease ATP-binding subunit ClpA n=1 Tax=Candidatus Liberibacter solanacearum TaxID=556287 RepID=A0A0F4VHJ0_9HYPH|nr:ATP-dependent Clp protease ATP-binding subunit ClpA [Candidatus Liberibacter solanacearum]KJZ80700.1 Clp protease ClpX [Candidatus Liberibacter solanacearum]KJZ81783.1 ATP-dependent Clp protease ATP-binding subunit ClpA [Candidatus Liberibacter solanacearum]KQC48846.1 ATP-dependent Clp protease ATP-binding subunit ClpA [Candidatus Liberibacter solanacearum]
MSFFSENLEKVLHQALVLANEKNNEYATLEHLLLALIDDSDAAAVMLSCNVNLAVLKDNLLNYIDNDSSNKLKDDFHVECKPTSSFQRVVQRAVIHVQSTGKSVVTGANIIVAFFAEPDSHATYFLQEQDMTLYDAVNFISHGIEKKREFANFQDSLNMGGTTSGSEGFGTDYKFQANPNPFPALNAYCIDLTEKAKKGNIDVLIGRREEINRTIQILCRRSKNNPLYVGDPGVGKTAIAEGFAKQIVDGMVPDSLLGTRVFSLDIGNLIAGTRYRGDFEERIKKIVKEIESCPGAILYIDEIHTLVGTGSASGISVDASNLLKPALSSGVVRCIGSTTYSEYRQFFEKDKALVRRFQKIDIDEPSPEDTIEIIKGIKPYFEEHHQLRYSKEAIKAAVELSIRHFTSRKLPDKAIDVIDEAGASQILQPASKRRKFLTEKDIKRTVASMNRSIHSTNISNDDDSILSNLEENLERVVYGQSEAIKKLVCSIKLARAGLSNPQKPIGCYVFSGPTGVGKTEISKQLALCLGIRLLRFDMSEYIERHAVARLIGAPPGYVGFDQGGLLSDSVDQNPYSIVLLDEIEKAHPDVVNILLQIMDYGMLTDQNGRKVSFRNVILIMTTNAGALEASRAKIGFGSSRNEGADKEALRNFFSPEFLNRLDSIVPFSLLSPEVIRQVVRKFIMQLDAQLQEKGISFHFSEEVISWLVKHGYDVKMGARPLERIIKEYIKIPLADEILFGKLKKGGGIVKVFLNPDKNPLVPICFEIENSSSNIPFEAEEKEAEDIKNQTDPLTVI